MSLGSRLAGFWDCNCSISVLCLLGGSWVATSGVISRVTIVVTVAHIRGFTTLTHEPPSRRPGKDLTSSSGSEATSLASRKISPSVVISVPQCLSCRFPTANPQKSHTCSKQEGRGFPSALSLRVREFLLHSATP